MHKTPKEETVIPTVGHWMDGQLIEDTARTQPVYNPATGRSERQVALASVQTVEAAIAAAEKAFPAWRNTPPLKRARVMSKFKVLLEAHADEIAALITAEHGKTLADAHGELQRGMENVEYASYAPELLKGEHSRNVGPGIDSWSEFQALPVPVAYHSFGGWKRSLFGDLHAYGPDAVRFYTKRKTITQRWPSAGVREGAVFSFPSSR